MVTSYEDQKPLVQEYDRHEAHAESKPRASWFSRLVTFLREVRPITWLKVALVLVLLVALGLFLIFAPWADWLGSLLEFVDRFGPWGPVILGELYIACTILLVPGSVLTLGAGLLFNLWKGVVTVSIASTIGATAAFLYGNTLLRGWVEKRISDYKIFGAIDRAIAKRGWVIVLLLRLSPVIPFNLLNYALGLTQIGVIPYMLASWIGMLPATVVYVYIGSLVPNIGAIVSGNYDKGIGPIILFVVGLIATIAALVIITWFAKREITAVLKELEETEAADEERQDYPLTGSLAGAINSSTEYAAPTEKTAADGTSDDATHAQ